MKTFCFAFLLFATTAIISSCKKPTGETSSCGTPTGAAYTSLTNSSVVLNWNPVSAAISYTVQYRPVGSSTWTSNVATSDSLSVTGLTASTIYEWQVQTICSTGLSAFTASSIFKTDTTPVPVYNITATYGGSVHTFISTQGLGGVNQGDLTEVSGTEAGTGNTLSLEQTYLTSSTSTFNYNPGQIPNSLALTIGSVTYQNNMNSQGSETRVVGAGTATITFNGTIYNTSNASDSMVITNGSYSGAYVIH